MSRNGRVAELGEPVRAPRRLAPVLAELVELVRRRADGDAAGERVAAAPRRRRRAGAPRRRGRARCRAACPRRGPSCWARGELLARAATAATRWNSTSAACRSRKLATPPRRGVLQLVGPVGPRQPVLLGERAPGGERRAGRRPPGRRTRRTTARAAGRAPTSNTSRSASLLAAQAASRSIRSSVVRAPGRRRRAPRPGRYAACVEAGASSRHVLDPQVQRVHEPPRRRQVRRRLHRRDRLGGVQRVDQHEVGVVRGRGPGGQVGEVAEVADAPRLGRAHLVQLRHQAHDPPVRDGRRQLESLRRHDEVGFGGAGSSAGASRCATQPVPAQRAGRRAPRRSPRPPCARRPRGRRTQRSTCGTSRHGAVLEHDVEPDTGARRHVGVHPRRPPLAGDDGGGQGAAPRCELGVDQRRARPRRRPRRVDAERGEHGPDRRRRDGDVLALPVPVLGRDPVGVGELDEPGRRGGGDHAPILPCGGRCPDNEGRRMPCRPRSRAARHPQVRRSGTPGGSAAPPSGRAGRPRPRSSRRGSSRRRPSGAFTRPQHEGEHDRDDHVHDERGERDVARSRR